jgi:hypothetical protein
MPYALPPLTPAQQIEHQLRNELVATHLEVDHLRAALETMRKARDFQRLRADRGWALYERTVHALTDLQEGELVDLREALAVLQQRE